MRDKMERLVLLPFAVGCMSESSVGVASPPTHRSSRAPIPQSPPKRNGETKREESDEETSSEEGKISTGLATLPKPSISTGIHRMFKGFKNFSHLFVYKEDLEEEEMEIRIGLPTDVKHVTHIGWDGCMANSDQQMKGRPSWDSYFIDPQLIQDNDLFQRITSSVVPTASSALEQLESWPGQSRKDIQTANPETRLDPVAVSLKG